MDFERFKEWALEDISSRLPKDYDALKDKLREDDYVAFSEEVIGDNSYYSGDYDIDGRREGYGIAVYEIEFEDVNAEFDYDITKAGGKIVNADRKVKIPACVAAEEKENSQNKTAKTGREAAIDAALSHAGFSADEVSALKCEKDYDDGREIYEVEFKQGGYEYSYDIDAKSFNIIKWDKDYDD